MQRQTVEELVMDDFIHKREQDSPYPQFRNYEEAEEYALCLINDAEEGTDIEILDHYSISDFIRKEEYDVEYYDVCGIPVYEDDQYEYDDHINTAICLMQTNGEVQHPVFKALGSPETMTCTVYEVWDEHIFYVVDEIQKMEEANV